MTPVPSHRKAWLTIDDSPSPGTDALVDFLAVREVPAILFCRGDRMAENSAPLARAVENGLCLANHSYSHRPAGDLSFEEIIEEIERTETLIEDIYRQTGRERRGKYFRFPYIDKGDGDRLERRFAEIIADPAAPLPVTEKTARIQDWLKREGFTQPFAGVTHPLYQNTAVAGGADCLFTYTSGDWMLTERHQGQWPYRSVDDLIRKMDVDPFLCREDGPQITLFHDQEGIADVAIALIDVLLNKGFSFLQEGDIHDE